MPHIDSEFTIAADPTDGGRLALYCKGTKPTSHKQQVIAGVDDMQLLYAVDGLDGHLQWRTANDITAATPVRAIGVCLQLSGERQQNAPGALDCQGAPITAPKSAGRAVRLARAIFRLRHAAG
ncbi:hypothetical protein GT347_00605 [Xylophilus rhododendri]|uniref:Uncharacterized protein n=1 Tax=Xylophilus rhododendri TaxID=2697032 RepID=A0A857J0Y9_9BURK|nr:PilW family protein [Xylophilus rhododendri]QHI96628.1 hypothetical protein GT347_00605 [Xylophilus rhododendri]